MVIIVKDNANKQDVKGLIGFIEEKNIKVKITEGEHKTILGLVGDTSKLDVDMIVSRNEVEAVRRIQEPYKLANRKFHLDDTIVDVNGIKIGGGNFVVMAGPCSVESEEQIIDIAKNVKQSGAVIMRGGAFKPRTSPYAFQGLGGEGLEYLKEARKVTGMPIVTEIMSVYDLDLFNDVDIIQVGARNMQNFSLLKELGKQNKPILLKRGLSNTIEELLMSAEYIMAGGNQNIILCERGIRTFETETRNTLDISAVPVLKKLTHLPVVIDPSHSGGRADLVETLSLAGVAVGCDGLIIEVHNDPARALCDGKQSLDYDKFNKLMKKVTKLQAVMKEIQND